MKQLFITALIAAYSSMSFSQASITLSPDKDNSIYEENTNSNGAGDDIFTGANNNLNPRHGLIHFNLSALPQGAIVVSAQLNLYVNKLADNAGGTVVKTHKLTANWGEGTGSGTGRGGFADADDAIWEKPFNGLAGFWATAGGDYTATQSGNTSIPGTGVVSISGSGMVADVQSWITSPASNFGWILIGDEAVPKSAMRFTSRENSMTNQRPTLVVTYTTLLPVNLLSFTGQVSGNDVLLNWKTATETNNLYFGIEHSNNGRNFLEIGKVAGAGSSVVLKSYQYAHTNPGSGTHFYRLAQHDINGQIHYSEMVAIELAGKKTLLQVVPNVVQGILHVTSRETLTGRRFSIINNIGQVVISGVLLGPDVDVTSLMAGGYHLVCTYNNGEIITAPFLKQ